ncbi:MAG: Shwachman-Bodian-Diamond syndrome protein [Methanoculleus marisnigri]|jgi:rRNA metabolism protein, SBDS family|uniref:Shwachman-Bodian-Diamond syndrome protein n=1 Tax=Methanoculleus marisnigri TaxID=2198 RepID=A0A101GP21_9EURY|nr:ribosome assembly factor SBDS [Methanoculleus marisnigri]KUK61866.1 MAG: Shwachman-Bodian-Diamond syndrome protein [Methanoculleus marisnigri]KUL01730.1 MAG: Shwachman-Bodian-Diamond syndrome protein [Methanoculleus marisnigri]
MIPLDQAVVARLESYGERFEVLVDPDQAMRIRQGEEIDIEDAVAADTIFSNSAHAERASDESLVKVFKTTEFEPAALRIIKKGEIHLTSEQRRHLIAEKRNRVITFIARNAVNPQSGFPHPPQRIELAMEEARVSIDPFKSVEEQVKEVVKALRPLLPIRFEEVRIAVKIPSDYAARAYGELQTAVTLEQSEWQKDGSLIAVARIPAGIQDEFYDLVNKLSRGNAETRIIERMS